MNCPVSGADILRLIPQRAPFVMIDALYMADELSAETGFVIPENNIFVFNGLFQEPGLIENIAQTAAAFTGYKELASVSEPKVGFIAAIKNLVIHKLPKAGQSIRTRVTFVDSVLEYMIIQGNVFYEDQSIASCEMKIFIKG